MATTTPTPPTQLDDMTPGQLRHAAAHLLVIADLKERVNGPDHSHPDLSDDCPGCQFAQHIDGADWVQGAEVCPNCGGQILDPAKR